MAQEKKAITRIASEVVGTVLKFHFPDGDDVKTVVVDVAGLPSNIQQYAVIHGIKQKLVDSMAIGVSTNASGRVVRPSLTDKFNAFRNTLDRISAGMWNEVREGPVGGMLYQAMARLYPDRWESAAQFAEFLDAQAEKRGVKRSVVEESLRRSPKVAPMIEQIRAEMGRETVDGDEILEELE
jgi:hypothetical protein